MSISNILARVRDGTALNSGEIRSFANGLADGSVSDAQAAAFAMAVCIKGLSEKERIELTLAMRDSGKVCTWALPGPVIDKHSTGGIGDNTSLILAPALAACGGFVPMVSGRGLGHTGGTLDKLEAIPGYQAEVSPERFEEVVGKVGCAIVGAGEGIAPADKRLYTIRDLTGTVESVDLITSSILSKKLAAGLEALVLDVKVGSGAFLRHLEEARTLAESLVLVASGSGCPTIALLTDMNEPLATSAGNAMEVESAMRVLRNEPGEERLLEVSLALGTKLMVVSGLSENERLAEETLLESLTTGRAAEVFAKMVTELGGPGDFVERPEKHLSKPGVVMEYPAKSSGFLAGIDGRVLGEAVIELGGGRKRAEDSLDHSAGLDQVVRLGSRIQVGDPLVRIGAADEASAKRVAERLDKAFVFSEHLNERPPLILQTLSSIE